MPELPSDASVVSLVTRLQAHFSRDTKPRAVVDALLPDLLDATASSYGFIAELWHRDDGAPYLRLFTLSDIAWNDATRSMMARVHDDGIEFHNLRTLFGAAITTQRPVIANDPAQDPRRAGLPPGHPALAAFLGLPLFHGGELVGMVGLANRPGGYDQTLVARLAPLWTTLGSIMGSIQLARERKRAAAALLERDALLRRLTEHVPAVIFQYRRTAGGWESMPFATEGLRRAYGVAPEAVRDSARPIYERVLPGDRTRLLASTAESARTLKPWRLEFRVEAPDGSGVRWHEGHALPQREADGGTLWHGYIVDITERKHYQEAIVSAEAAQHANAAKTEFLSRMSHELRTPLNAVLGFAQLLQLDLQPLSELQRQRIGHIERAGAHLLAMINDVLDLSRIEAGTMPLSFEPLGVGALLEHVVALVASQAQAADVQIVTSAPPATLHLRADRVRLSQVLVNLLSNAIKYNRRGGMVHLRAEGAGEQVAIAVADTGIGLTPDQLAHLWEPFNRLGAERTPVEGTGIGLALSQRMVQLMDGRIEVQSDAGRGSCFTVHLPAAPQPQPLLPQAEIASPVAATRNGHVRTVLYAEDNPINVELVQQVFQLRPQLRLVVAASGAEALRLAQAEPPDLLLLDMHLGDMSGHDLRTALAAAGIEPPCVALSADVQPARVRRALAAGFADYLAKPLDVGALVRCLDRVLG